jgi:hypothetical protein
VSDAVNTLIWWSDDGLATGMGRMTLGPLYGNLYD